MYLKILPLVFLPIIFLQSYNKNVFTLKPNDIQCFGGIGDSITAGFSLNSNNFFQSILENRGGSFSMGGDEGYITLPNIFKSFGGNTLCASTGQIYPVHFYFHLKKNKDGKYDSVNDRCNSAISGATSDTLDIQREYLYNQLKEYNCLYKWKIITIFIGSNDICASCLEDLDKFVESYLNNVNETLRFIEDNIPYTFINLVTNLDVIQMRQFSIDNNKCKIVHHLIDECPCILGNYYNPFLMNNIEQYKLKINEGLYKLEEYYSPTNSFRVVIQPFMEKLNIPNSTFLSKLDCFHPAEMSQKLMAIHLWNNMFQPKNNKTKFLNISATIYQPKDSDYLQ